MARLDIEVEKKSVSKRLPWNAIRTGARGASVDSRSVDRTLVRKPVELGLRGDAYVEIRKGVELGEVVAVEPW